MHLIQANQPQQLNHPLPPLSGVSVKTVHVQRFGDDVLHPLAGRQGRIRILEDDLHLPPPLPHRAGAKAQQIGAVEHNRAAGRLRQAQQHAAGGGFAAAGFTDQRQGFARRNIERHAVHGLHQPDTASKNHATLHGEVGFQTSDFKECFSHA